MGETVRAEITGTVWKVEVTEGQAVTLDRTLLILESMKMEMPVAAPRAGRVVAVHVREGDAVEEDDPLVTLE
jgi:acetyl-CoA carboxylase biotin carboxyl carrier protein